MKLRAILALGLILLAGPALAQTHKHKAKPHAAAPHTLVSPEISSNQITYLGQLAPVPVVTGSDTTFWCDQAAGCGPGVDLKRVTAQQIGNYAVGRLGVLPPLSFNGSVVSLNYDSTLSVVGNQLHVNAGSGGGGFPWVLGGTTIPGASSIPLVTALQLTNSVLNGNVGGSPNYTATPSYTGLSSGTPVVCLGLDAGNHLITTPAVGGVCGGGAPGSRFRLTNSNGKRLTNTNGFRLTNAS